MTMPWAPAAATGVGSMPGTSAREAARIVAGELPAFLHVVELPGRGPGADLIGRTGGLLCGVSADLSMETTTDGWRLAVGIGRQMRRAVSFLGEDLDALEETAGDYAGPLKVQVAGPWTLAACVELSSGERALRDPGAVTDIAAALAEAVRAHVADVQRRVPRATVLVQLDEPALPAVLAGRIGTASGLSSYRAVDPQEAERILRVVLDAARDAALPGVHCCAGDAPVALLRASGAAFLSLDLIALGASADEAMGAAWEGGVGLIAGSVPSLGVGGIGDARASEPVRALMGRLGLGDERALARLAISPTCGLAGASPQWARSALAAARAAGRVVRNDATEGDVDDEQP